MLSQGPLLAVSCRSNQPILDGSNFRYWEKLTKTSAAPQYVGYPPKRCRSPQLV
jgi:hypothetical protein